LKLHFIIQLFLLVGMQGLVLSPGAGYPRYATDTHTLVYERCEIIWSLANQALITSSLSRKDERIAKVLSPKRQQVSFPAFFLTLHAERQRGNL